MIDLPMGDLSALSMAQLFRLEAESHLAVLTGGLLALERSPGSREQLDALMRAAHSMKGAARMVGLDPVVRVAHAMEDLFVAVQAGTSTLTTAHVDVLLRGVDLLTRLAEEPEGEPVAAGDVDAFLAALLLPTVAGALAPPLAPVAEPVSPAAAARVATPARSSEMDATAGPATVRVGADHLNRMLGLASESLVTSRWVTAFSAELLRLKRLQSEVRRSLSTARELAATVRDEPASEALRAVHARAVLCDDALTGCLSRLDAFDRRSIGLSHRLYSEVLAARMRPFGDGIRGLPRMVRDLARTLGKDVRLVITGEATPVDRDILQRLESPLVHLLRNVVDHGIETPEERRRAGKSHEGEVRLEARHGMGMLIVAVSDDGRGADPEKIRRTVVERRLAAPELAAKLSDSELMEFLFLPGMSTAADVTEISGRGVGLNVVQTMVREVRGRIDVTSQPGRGMRVQLQLPLTLSVMRALAVTVAGEPYALPLARVVRVVRLPRAEVLSVEGREHFFLDDRSVGLVASREVLGVDGPAASHPDLSVVVLGDKTSEYGLVVDALLGEFELVVRPLDPRLGRVPHLSAAALMPDGAPVLVVDVDDLIRSTEVLLSGGRLALLGGQGAEAPVTRARRVLVVDDSITVRETERKLLEHAGYQVDVAVDGMDAWNAVRTGNYDLVLTDVDMPRLDGIELTKLIRKDHRLKMLPVMMVSYKDREEDRLRGLEAGADYYLTKASFHDDTLLRATESLIGGARQ